MKGVVAVLLALVVLSSRAGGATEPGRHRYALKTIRSEDGDVIDCVNKYKQPSLLHVPAANRTHVLRSSSSPPSSRSTSRKAAPFQVWQTSGRCPPNTVPILRHPSNKHPSSTLASNSSSKEDVERAIIYTFLRGPFHGASADIESWSVDVMPNEYSMGAITLAAASNAAAYEFRQVNFTLLVRAGVMVNPYLFGDGKTRLFAQWSNDGGATTGCFNLLCVGFVQTSSHIALGGAMKSVSTYNDTKNQHILPVRISLDGTLPRWYLYVDNEEVGYWPIDGLLDGFYNAPFITWGGQVLNTWPGGRHTNTHMGNGHEADAGPTRAAMFRKLIVQKYLGNVTDVEDPKTYADRPGCYSVHYLGRGPSGSRFTYGGPGGPFCTD